MNKTRKIKNKAHVKKKNKNNEKYEGNISNIDKIKVDDKVGCITVKN